MVVFRGSYELIDKNIDLRFLALTLHCQMKNEVLQSNDNRFDWNVARGICPALFQTRYSCRDRGNSEAVLVVEWIPAAMLVQLAHRFVFCAPSSSVWKA